MIKDNSKLRKYNISVNELAEMCGYSSTESFLSAKKRDKMIAIFEKITCTVEEYIIDYLKRD